MKTNLAAGTFLSVLFWALLSVSLFAAPVIGSGRIADPAAQAQDELRDLIRLHEQATSPLPQLPARTAESAACDGPADRAASEESRPAMSETGAGDPDAPIIRPVGKRAERIEV
jgi:hypothetical protein